MADRILNRDLLADNTCLGCGHANEHGFQIEIRRDPDDPDRLVGRFEPTRHMVGFPGITHGGAIYTALDCMAAWTPTVLRRETRAIWILGEAAIKYRRPAHAGVPLSLTGSITKEIGPWRPVEVYTEARDPASKLLAEGTFTVVPLSRERFTRVAEIDAMPANWQELLDRDDV